MVSEADTDDTKIILTDGVEFKWEKVPGARDYLLRLPETNFLRDKLLRRKSENDWTSTALRVRGLQWFYCVSFIGQAAIVSLMTLLFSFVIYNLH